MNMVSDKSRHKQKQTLIRGGRQLGEQIMQGTPTPSTRKIMDIFPKAQGLNHLKRAQQERL
jgi:hypothetical protein